VEEEKKANDPKRQKKKEKTPRSMLKSSPTRRSLVLAWGVKISLPLHTQKRAAKRVWRKRNDAGPKERARVSLNQEGGIKCPQ